MAVSELEVDGVVFPSLARPPGSEHAHFLAGAGDLSVNGSGDCDFRFAFNVIWCWSVEIDYY